MASPGAAPRAVRLVFLALAGTVATAGAAEPPCAVEGQGYKGKQLTVNGGFPEDASACQALCQSSPECSYFTYYSGSKACWLLGSEALIGPDVAGSVSAPKVCPAESAQPMPVPAAATEPAAVSTTAMWKATIAPGISITGVTLAPFLFNNASAAAAATLVADAAAPLEGQLQNASGAITAREAPLDEVLAGSPSSTQKSGISPGVGIALAALAGVAGCGVAYVMTRGKEPKSQKATSRSLKAAALKAERRDLEASEERAPDGDYVVEAPLLDAIDFRPLTAQDTPLVISSLPSLQVSSPSMPYSSTSLAAPSLILPSTQTYVAAPPSPTLRSVALPTLTSVALPSVVTSVAMPATSVQARSTFCQNCGNTFAPDAEFCRKCGSRRV
eukprot:TRINITY_DN75990_c0_g1_i1.p1 TRINITY_DN75990_c0_g1~~TRINITY_DN75990_c0_g1_i1.p1  ORF type:complete len:387 (-),score=60.13 TRINITY_DN75990_c0_g1_i1:50-1210(-)